MAVHCTSTRQYSTMMFATFEPMMMFVLHFYGPINPMG